MYPDDSSDAQRTVIEEYVDNFLLVKELKKIELSLLFSLKI